MACAATVESWCAVTEFAFARSIPLVSIWTRFLKESFIASCVPEANPRKLKVWCLCASVFPSFDRFLQMNASLVVFKDLLRSSAVVARFVCLFALPSHAQSCCLLFILFYVFIMFFFFWQSFHADCVGFKDSDDEFKCSECLREKPEDEVVDCVLSESVTDHPEGALGERAVFEPPLNQEEQKAMDVGNDDGQQESQMRMDVEMGDGQLQHEMQMHDMEVRSLRMAEAEQRVV